MKKEGFMQGVLALMYSQVIIKILGLIYSIYLTNKKGFGDSGNAIYMSGYQVYALLLTLSSIGVPNAISKLISEKIALNDFKGAEKVFKIAFFMFATIGFCGSLILYLGAETIARTWLQIPEAQYTLMLLAPAIFFVSISSVIRGYFNGKQNLTITAKSQMIEQFFKTTCTIIFVESVAKFTNSNPEIMAASANFATTIATFISFFYIFILYKFAKKEIKILKNSTKKSQSAIDIIKKILSVSIPVSVSSLIAAINKNIDSLTVVRLLKPIIGEASAKSRYGILSSKIDILTSMPLAFNIAFATALVPTISAARVKNDVYTINKRLRFSMLITILIGMPCTFGMALYSKQILGLLFPNASSGANLLCLSSITIIFTVMTQTINGALQGLGKIKTPAIALGIGVFVKMITNILLIPVEDIYEKGAVIGSILCNIVTFSIVYSVLKKTIQLKFSISIIIIKPLIISCMMSIISYIIYLKLIIFATKIATIFGIVSAIIVYIILVVMFRVLSKEDIFMLPNGEKIYKILKKFRVYQ